MKIEIELSGFTPILDTMVQQYGLITAGIYGIVWRYAQMENSVCNASLEKIGGRLDVSGKTAERHVKKLCSDGYLTDLTPGIRNKPHSYAVTDKAQLNGSITARSDGQSDLGQTESLTRSDRESYLGQTESPLKIDSKTDSKTEKDLPSANADYSLPISLLSEREVRALKLPLSDWKQYLADEQAERNRKGVIDFIEKKITLYELRPEGPNAEKMFELLEREYKNKGRRPPTHFPTTICKENFNAASVSLNGVFETALRAAIGSGIIAIPKIVRYISSPKWQEDKNDQNQNRANDNRSPRGNKTNATNFAPPPGSGQTPEMARKLREAFAPKI